MTSTPTPRRKLFLLLGSVALLAASFVLTAPRTAAAVPKVSCFCSYYSDGTYSTQVGEYDVYCSGHISRWGTQTSYSLCDCEGCSFPY